MRSNLLPFGTSHFLAWTTAFETVTGNGELSPIVPMRSKFLLTHSSLMVGFAKQSRSLVYAKNESGLPHWVDGTHWEVFPDPHAAHVFQATEQFHWGLIELQPEISDLANHGWFVVVFLLENLNPDSDNQMIRLVLPSCCLSRILYSKRLWTVRMPEKCRDAFFLSCCRAWKRIA